MKIVLPALAAAFIATVGASSAAQAAVHHLDFGVVPIGGHVTYSGISLDTSTALDLDASLLTVSQIGVPDDSGLAVGDHITVTPTDIIYGSGTGTAPLASDITKSWTATTGPNAGDMFTELLTTVTAINRATANAITVTLSGTITDTMGLFSDTPAFMIISANQVGSPGAGNAVAVALTNTATVPEPATWVMLALGFAGLGYAAVRRSAKDKAAMAV